MEDVNQAASPPADDQGPEHQSAEGVTPDSPTVTADERPMKNYMAEMTRRYEATQKQMADMAAAIAAMAQQRYAAPQPQTGHQYSEQELSQLAQSGSVEAYQELARRAASTEIARNREQATVVAQIQALMGRYPAFGNPQSVLHQRALQFRNVLVQTGSPVDARTTLDAMLRAVADSPEEVASMVREPARASEESRRDAATRGGQDGVSHRRDAPAPRKGEPHRLSEKEMEIAKRMGIKDPAKSRERFFERQSKGRSAVSHTIEPFLREE